MRHDISVAPRDCWLNDSPSKEADSPFKRNLDLHKPSDFVGGKVQPFNCHFSTTSLWQANEIGAKVFPSFTVRHGRSILPPNIESAHAPFPTSPASFPNGSAHFHLR